MPDDLATRLASVASTGSSAPAVSSLQTTDVPATHELGPNGITPKGGDLATRVAAVAEGKPSEPLPPPKTAEQTLSDHDRYMVSAMTGQGKDFSQDPTLSPEERQQAEAGRKAGTIQGGTDIALGALGGAALGPLDTALKYLGFGAKAAKVAEPVATGLLDQYGSPIFRALEPEVRPVVQQLLSHEAVQKGLKIAGNEILKGALYGAGGTGAYKVLHLLFDSK